MRKLIRPGGTIGVLGSGHVARQVVRAADTLGYRVRHLDADAKSVADHAETALRRTRELADGCDVVTVASEDVRVEQLEAVAARTLLRPGVTVLATTQHRARERAWLEQAGFTLLPWRAAESRDALVDAVRELGGPCWVKPQLRRRAALRPVFVSGQAEAASAWVALRGAPVVVEACGRIEAELSVLVARSVSGDVTTYAPTHALRVHGRLIWSTFPGSYSAQLAGRARDLAGYIARKLDVQGLLAVELFLLADGRLVVNELAPAPHPTYHATDVACQTSQYEQLVRAVTGLPLGATGILRHAATVALTETPGQNAEERIARMIRVPGVHAHLYPLAEATDGTVGHLSAVGDTVDEAVTRVLLAEAARDPRRARALALQRDRVSPVAWPRRRPRALSASE